MKQAANVNIESLPVNNTVVTHAHKRAVLSDRCLCPYIYIGIKNKFESYFSDRLTLSNIRSRTSRRIYRLPLLSPETLSSLSKLRIFLFNVHLALFVQRMT